jgi:hypothetical protein
MEVVEEQIRVSRENFETRGFGYFSLILRDEGEMIGFAGLREAEGEGVELLYALDPAHWGSGLATEAAFEVLRWGFFDAGLDTILAGADPPNRASFEVMRRLGMVFSHESTAAGVPVRYHVMKAETFPSPAGEDRNHHDVVEFYSSGRYDEAGRMFRGPAAEEGARCGGRGWSLFEVACR